MEKDNNNVDEVKVTVSPNVYAEQFEDLLVASNLTMEDLIRDFGFTINDYLHPTEESVERLKIILNAINSKKETSGFGGK